MSLHTTRVVFAFPGQGSYHYPILKELYGDYPETRSDFELADETCRSFFGLPFLPLVTAANEAEHDRILSACPDLDQVGIYLTEVVLSGLLRRRGIEPALVVGHSFGEIAALTTAGVFDPDCGFRIVCQRIHALQSSAVEGRMAAVSSNVDRTMDLIERAAARTLSVSVINHPNQTVVSGASEELEALREVAESKGVSVTLLKSRYPFHSTLLERAVGSFRINLKSYRFKEPATPVYLCTEGKLLTRECDLPEILATQFVKRLDFKGIVHHLVSQGYFHFIECGAGDIVSKLIGKNAPQRQNLIVESTAVPGTGVRQGLERVLARAREDQPPQASAAAASVGSNDPEWRAPRRPERAEGAANVHPPEPCREMPVAIIAMGCVLPGAANAEEFWQNILDGVNGIVDLTEHDPHARHDFIGGTPDRIVSDKSYTLLNGSILETAYDPGLLLPHYSEVEFRRLTRGQRILALAVAQALAGASWPNRRDSVRRVQCILGATADGSEEYDEALFADCLYARLAKTGEAEPVLLALEHVIEKATGYARGASAGLIQDRLYRPVVDRLVGRTIKTYVVDTACSSSLYSIDLAIKALQNHDVDFVLAGGVFAPGPANNTLFAQFRGLTPSECRPLDVAADGVVFGDGAGIVALKRLPEALADGDRILAVVRGLGLSSDGRSPSINVPQAEGQRLAIERAYAASGVDMATIQYVEAHATATPVGDATEFKGLAEAFSPRPAGAAQIELGSVKSLIGHTGWASGVASVIKFCLAFAHRTIPKQHFYDTPNREFALDQSPFTIARATHAWPENVTNLPRRVGINGFGFGGTNAHMVLEEFDRDFHGAFCAELTKSPTRESALAIVGLAGLFPGLDRLESAKPGGPLQFNRAAMRLPAKKLLLPDVRDHMDASQYLASLAAEQVLAGLPEGGTSLKNETGVVLGLSSKTDRGMRADERIFLDRFRRLVSTRDRTGETISEAEVTRLVETLCQGVTRENLPSGPYTLPGLMPNVAASRISNLFDLRGPNLVIDRGADSLLQAIFTAERLLLHDNCRMVLAGGLSATAGPDGMWAERALLMGLTTLETAAKLALPVQAVLKVITGEEAAGNGATALSLAGEAEDGSARMVSAILEAMELVRRGETALLKEPDAGNVATKALHFAPAGRAAEPRPAAPAPGRDMPAGAYAFVANTPIYTMTPVLVPVPASAGRQPLNEKRILLLTDQAEWWAAVEASGAMVGYSYRVVCPAGSGVSGATPVEIAADPAAEASLRWLDPASIDAIVVLKSLANRSAGTLLQGQLDDELALLELLFAVAKHCYARLGERAVSVSSICLNAFLGSELDPYTGLVAGFLKSLARELPRAACSIVNFDGANVLAALSATETELGQSTFAGEVSYRGGFRHVLRLESIEALAADERPCLTQDSVVIATGGGRGVTATLCETLLESFGCTVLALGRTTLAGVSPRILDMPEAAYQAYEKEFYREELARDPRQKIAELRSRYYQYQAANELQQVIRRQSALRGRFEYHCIDITDAVAVDALVQQVYDRYGRVDLVLHGAGIQVSKIIPKKTLDVFRKVVTTKLAGLQSLYQACRRRQNGAPVHYHLLTSAFSYLGNDGQPDYGAANEALNRVAAGMAVSEPGTYWSAMAWLGWAGIGMTRGSEFAALAANRRLRGVSKEEGQDIFRRLMAGRPARAINVLMADGEIQFYQAEVASPPQSVQLAPPVSPRRGPVIKELDFTVDTCPYLLDHLVRGVPTLPGAFIIAVVADFAGNLRPGLKITAFEQTEFLKFVSVYPGKGIQIRLEGTVISEDENHALIQVRVLSDFRHKSGAILQKDIVHTDLRVRMARRAPRPPQPAPGRNGGYGLLVPDPYVMAASPVRLNGQFSSIRTLTVGQSHRDAEYRLRDCPYRDSAFLHLLPNAILVDAFWRFGTVEVKPNRTLSVFVPRKCDIMKVYFDYTDFGHAALMASFSFSGTNPRVEGDLLHVGPIEVRDQSGAVQLVVEGGLCQRFGDIENAF